MTPYGISELIDSRGGVVRTRTLRLAGATRGDLRRAVASDAVVRVREGVYATPRTHPLVHAAAAHGGELACVSALRRRGVWVLDDADLHVWVGPHGRTFDHDGCRCVTHRDDGVAAFGEVGVTRALVQVASCLGDEAFFAAFESAWRLGLLGATERAEVRASLRPRQRWLVDIARGDADSGLESILRLRLLRLGITVTRQVRIPTVGCVDVVIDGVLILEADGRAGHAREAERHKDLVRDARAAALGFETLRFDYALILHDWPLVRDAVLARLARIRRAGRRTGGAPVAP
ncbi:MULTISPECIES: type IV toxin-antitoxin system AbiEi family antitoxin domain-containing protein [unclassified Microbacterium]|uniref:type IV toxin-antitoxin system AbiEi family antitoxin domain-containing protein n=1 Tax=unclassified Microbacterium TaxID=2609290 RepID=UPI003016EE64